MKKIVIMPIFCDTHFIKFQISNIIDTIAPDYIVYNEGMFPQGPEGTTKVNNKFLEDYTLDGHRGFDYEELKLIIEHAQEKYSNTKIILNEINYPSGLTPQEYYIQGCSNFKELGIDIEEGDCIFPYEGDVFHHEDTRLEIKGYCEQLEPNTGFRSTWLDFLETQYYVEKRLFVGWKEGDGRSRRVCIKFGDWNFYNNVLENFITQEYPMLHPTDLLTFHYSGWRPGKYKEMRFGSNPQLNRDQQYHNNFKKGLDRIRKNGNKVRDDVIIRPTTSAHLNGRYACFIDIEHPRHIREHSNFIK